MADDAIAPGEAQLAERLVRWSDRAQTHLRTTVFSCLVLTLVFAAYAGTHIGFNADPNALFSKDLRFQRAIAEFEQYFPVLTNALLIVIDGETPERTREAAEILLPALDAQRDVFYRAFQPGEDRFFQRHGLLYATPDDLDSFANHIAVMQPVLAELARDPSLPTLSDIIRTGLDAVRNGDTGDSGWEMVLQHMREATQAVRQGEKAPLSWESLLMQGTGFDPSTRTVLVAEPILDVGSVLAAQHALDTVRATAERLGLTPDRGVVVQLTGYPALNHEEMIGLATDTAVAGALSFVLVVLVLLMAFRSAHLVIAAALTLIAGLVWAAAFSAATVQELNPLSITFGVLVIGLGIDFMIHLGMHFVEEAAHGYPVEDALRRSVRDTGPALVLCATTTGVGFLAFVPTDFSGVSDLGLAAAGGMVAILILTLTLFPALIRGLFTPRAVAALVARGPTEGFELPRPGRPALVVAGAALLGICALPLLPRVDLETNIISIRNQETESVRTFKELLGSRATTPWYLDALAPSLDKAVSLADEIRDLDTVDEVATLASYVPEDQETKLEILGDISLMLGLPRPLPRTAAAPELQLATLRELARYLSAGPVGDHPVLAEPVRALADALGGFVAEIDTADDPRVSELADVLLDPIPDQIRRLQNSLDVGEVTREDLPSALVERMLSEDGHARVQAFPANDLRDHDTMVEFVESIRPIWGNITGLPVNLVESARTTWESLHAALLWATLAITTLLLILWRRIGSTLMAICPLLLAVLLTQVMTVVLPISFNFVNVIVLPLLLGIGVDSGIHLVERARSLRGSSENLLGTTTARAVCFSGLTTIASFGTLMISTHRGVSSLGILLVIGMIWTLAANLGLLPALLALRGRRSDTCDATGVPKERC